MEPRKWLYVVNDSEREFLEGTYEFNAPLEVYSEDTSYGIFNILAPGWVLSDQPGIKPTDRIVPPRHTWLFTEPLRVLGSEKNARRLLRELIDRRLRDHAHRQDRLAGEYVTPDGLEIRTCQVIQSVWSPLPTGSADG